MTPTLLVVDDNADDSLLIALQIKQQLGELQWRQVRSMSEIVSALTEEWTLVVLDYVIPGLDWPRAIRAIRSAMPSVPIIVVSGAVMEDYGRRGAAEEYADDYVSKNKLLQLGPVAERVIATRAVQAEHHKQTKSLIGKIEQSLKGDE